MKKSLFWILFAIILTVSLLLKLIPTLRNNFYFTMDAGRDAVYVRDMLTRGNFPLLGPVTSIDGLYDGPLWYYFITPGYIIFGGHPFGAVFMLIILSLGITAYIMLKIREVLSAPTAIILGLALQVSWFYFDASRYAFNPLPLVFLAILLLFFLTDCLTGEPKKIYLAAILVGLAFHADVAGALAFLLFYLTVAIWGTIAKRITFMQFILSVLIVGIFFIPHLVSELKTDFSQFSVLQKEMQNPKSVFAQTGLRRISSVQLIKVTKGTVEQASALGLFTLIVVAALAFLSRLRNKKINRYIATFTLLAFGFLLATLVFFSTNTGWRPYQTLYIYPVLYLTLLLLLTQISKIPAVLLFIFSVTATSINFFQAYKQNLRPTQDPSLLANEVRAVDWVYAEADGKGFYVYSFLPSVYDYPYQYLFWWWGRKQYGYIPCEYSSYPGTPKLFVPGSKYYQEPKRECQQFRYLVIEPDDEDNSRREMWLTGTREGTTLVKSTKIGRILVEKRRVE